MTSTKAKEEAADFSSSLADLTVNSKTLINMLTMLADDKVEHAAAIVEEVETHLQKVRSDCKLPVLYLIDSIVKNVNGPYLSLFSQNIVNTFCSVFETVDETTRASMWKLRQTWNEVFPAKKMFSLDVRVHAIDPAWPVTNAKMPTGSSIHVNPRFLVAQTPPAPIVPPVIAPVKLPLGEPVSMTEAAMREQLLKKQRELLELQKQNVELQLLQAQTSLAAQQSQMNKKGMALATELIVPTAHVIPTTDVILGRPVAPVVPSQSMKQVAKQFPAATASLLKNITNSNGPRIAPASSIAVASARPISRDPRLKPITSSSQDSGTAGIADPRMRSIDADQSPTIRTVISDQLKQQLITKQAVTSTIVKTTSNNAGTEFATTSNASNNDNNPNATTNATNINNKILIGNIANKDGVSNRASQKKDSRSSSNSSVNVNSTKIGNNCQASGDIVAIDNAPASSSSTIARGGGGNDSKSKDAKSARVSSSTSGDKASASSKSSNRKLGTKSRSKQSQSPSPCKITKLDRDSSSPVRSKSRDNDVSEDSTASVTRISPQSSSQSSKSRNKKSVKMRKRSPSPPYRIPRRNDAKLNTLNIAGGLTEEEQSGSLIVSPPHPPAAFKDIRANTRQRNYVRRNKEDDASPEPAILVAPVVVPTIEDITMEAASKDEDLRSSLPLTSTAVVPIAPVVEKKEDLDLRVLPPVNKRQSGEGSESNPSKKSKAEKFDALFGNEDVDLRTLTHPNAGRPPTPPPPVISGDDGKDGWAKLKSPMKGDREKQLGSDRDRNKDRLGRPRLYNKLPDDPKERRRTLSSDDQDSRSSSRRSRDSEKMERHAERNMDIIMKQAAEQLKQGCITNSDYNTLIQEVLHMSEEQKIRKHIDPSSMVWEQNLNSDMKRNDRPGSSYSPSNDDLRGKDHHPRNRNGPRWQNHQPWQQPPGPWAHPPGPAFNPPPHGNFNSEFRPVGPWQNPRHFGPMRPDFHPYNRNFNANMPVQNPRMSIGINGPMVPNGPIMPNMIQNGPIVPMGIPTNPMQMPVQINGPAPILINGPLQSGQVANIIGAPIAVSRNLSPNAPIICDLEDSQDSNPSISRHNSRELPPPDPKTLEAIANDRMKSIDIDGTFLEIRYYGQTGIVFVKDDDPREIGFQDGTRRVLIDDKDTIICAFNEPYKEFIYDGEVHRIRLGGPSRELYIDDRWYECYFGGLPIKVELGNKTVTIKLEGPPPQVKIGTSKRTDLVVGKVNLYIDRREPVPVFVDAKPQIIEIDGKPQVFEIIDALERVLLNGRPFKLDFGGLPTVFYLRGKSHDFRFSRLPAGVRPGYVKITGMRGEPAKEFTPEMLGEQSVAVLGSHDAEVDAGSQESGDLGSANNTGKNKRRNRWGDYERTTKRDKINEDLQVLPSASLTPTVTVSQVDTVEKPAATVSPALALPLNMNELFQRLVATGIVPNLPEPVKTEDEEKKAPAIIEVSFAKPETLKVKQPGVAAALYSGIQCSSCGARFAPELATRYSRHLDWHFRQNSRRRGGGARKESRSWYYDVSDWIQFEEVEDLEDRAQSWFETEKQSAETEGTATESSQQETVQPSVPTGTNEELSRCQVCHDAFEQFYNEEKEEWHLRPAVSYEEHNYHPLCLEDHKLALERSILAIEEEAKKIEAEESTEIPTEEAKTVEAEVPENLSTECTEDTADEKTADGDSENAVETTDKISTEETTAPVDETKEEEKSEAEKTGDGEEPAKIDDETAAVEIAEEEKVQSDDAAVNSFENVKIKEEPIDGAETLEEQETFHFDDVEVKLEPQDPDLEESIVPETAVVDTTHTAVKSSIDGNVELVAPAPMPSAPSRIKINITKPLTTSKDSEEAKEKPVTDTPEEEDNTTPLAPATLKPTLQGRKLSNLPPVEKGRELSGLCSIM